MRKIIVSFALSASLGLAGISDAKPPVATQPQSTNYNRGIVVTPLLQTSATSDGKPIAYPKTDSPEVRMLLVEIPPGAETGWHKHPMPCYAYILAGSVTVEVKGGKRCSYHAGQAFAETVNTLHNGKNTGKVPLRILMTVTGVKGIPTTELPKKD